MMIAVLLLLAQVAPAAPTVGREDTVRPPHDWSILPMLHYRTAPAYAADLSGFVRAEVIAGRCAHATPAANGWTLTIDLAVFATADGTVRRIVPRAIDCPTVEQYATGLASRMARSNIDSPGVAGWYRTSVTFAWNK